MKLDTNQKGHWYTCRNENCKYKFPLPDRAFRRLKNVESEVDVECLICEVTSPYSFALHEAKTTKKALEKFFGIKPMNPKLKVFGKRNRA